MFHITSTKGAPCLVPKTYFIELLSIVKFDIWRNFQLGRLILLAQRLDVAETISLVQDILEPLTRIFVQIEQTRYDMIMS